MKNRTYLITLDLLDPTLELDGLKEFIKTSSLFLNWWNHIPGVFLVVSEADAATISKAVRRYTNEARLLVIETRPEESDGWISERGWKWLRRRSSQETEQPAAE
jgi:hypothetical protein